MSNMLRTAAFQLLAFIVLFGISMQVRAQNEGNSAISANTSGTIAPSAAYIDASPFFSISNDICKTINGILTSASGYGSYPSSGAVVDARGILPNPPTNPLGCSVNQSKAATLSELAVR